MNQAALSIAIYIVAILVIGVWKQRLRGLVDFHLAGRRQGVVAITGTLCATILGASTTIGMAGLGYSRGLAGSWWMLSGTIGMLFLAAFFAGKIRTSGCSTLPQLVGSFWGERARNAASILIAVSWIGVIAVQIIASGNILVAVFGGDAVYYMAFSTAIFVLYTIYGGKISVIKTDLVQLLIIILGLVILFWEALNAAGPMPHLGQSFPASAGMDYWAVISMILVVGSAYLIGPDMYSNIFCAHSSREAKISTFISAIILIPLAFLITSLGIFSSRLYPAIPPEQAIPSLMTGLLSPLFEGLVAAALLAAFMSSADTCLMTATSILTFDIYGKIYDRIYCREARKAEDNVRKAEDNANTVGCSTCSIESIDSTADLCARTDRGDHLMKVSRIAVLIIGASALLLAVSIPEIIKTLLIVYTVYTSGLLAPVVAGFYKGRLGLTSTGALSAIAGGGITAIFLGQSYPLLGMAVSAVLLFGVSGLEKELLRRKTG